MIDNLPNGWKEENISDVVFFQEGPGVRKTQFTEKGVKLLNVGNINDNKINLSTTKIYISEEEAYGKYSHFLIEDGDLLIACSGIVVNNFHKKIAFITKKDLPLCLNTSTMRFRTLDEKKLDINFYKYFLMTNLFKNQLQRLITGSAQLNFGPSHIKQMFIPIPPIQQQEKIVKVLDLTSNLIEKQKELLEKYDLFLKSKFIEMFGNLEKNQFNWKVLKLDSVCEITSSKRVYKSDYVSEGIPFYKIKEIILMSKNIQPKNIEYISKDTFDNFANKFGYPQNNDILLSAVGATIGHFYLVDVDYPFYFKDGNLLWLRNYKIDINKNFLLYLFRSDDFKNKIFSFTKGAAQDAITIVNLKSTQIFIPSIELQNQFGSIVEKIEIIKEKENERLEQLKDLHNSMMNKAFKGEIE